MIDFFNLKNCTVLLISRDSFRVAMKDIMPKECCFISILRSKKPDETILNLLYQIYCETGHNKIQIAQSRVLLHNGVDPEMLTSQNGSFP
jgi:hypothetical protein